MAIGYGLGLGLQGTPRDYVELAKNREAAKQKYQAEQQKKKADEVNEVMKNFMGKVPVETVLPVHKRAKEEAIAGFYKTAMDNVGSDTPNMMQVYQSATETIGRLNDYNEQFKIMKQLQQNPGASGLFQNDIDIVSSVTDPIQLQTDLEEKGSGGLRYDANTGFFSIGKIGKFQPASAQLTDFVTKNKDLIFYDREQGAPQRFNVNNTTVEYFGMDQGAKNMFMSSALSGDNFESIRREFRTNEISNGRKPPAQGSPEEAEAVKGYVSGLYDQAAATLLDDRNYTKSKGITINNFPAQDQKQPGTPDFNPRTNKILSESNAFSGGAEYTALGTYSIPSENFLTSVPTYARNTDTGEQVSSSQGEFRNGSIQIVPLTKQARTLRDPNSGMEITLEAGTIIPNNLLREFVANDFDFEYNTVAFGAFKPVGKDSEIPVYFLSKDTENNVFFGQNKENKKAFEAGLKAVQDKVKTFKNLPKEKKAEMMAKYGNVETIFENIGTPESKQLTGAPAPAKSEPPKNNQSGSKTPTYGDKKTPKIKAGQTYSKDDVDKLSGGEHWSKKFKLVNGQYIAK